MMIGAASAATDFQWLAGDPQLWFTLAKVEGGALLAFLIWQVKKGGLRRWLEWIEAQDSRALTRPRSVKEDILLAIRLDTQQRRAHRAVKITFYAIIISWLMSAVLFFLDKSKAPASTVEWFAIALVCANVLALWFGIPSLSRALGSGVADSGNGVVTAPASGGTQDLISRMLEEIDRLQPPTLQDIGITLMRLALDKVSVAEKFSGEDAYLRFLSDEQRKLMKVDGAQVLALCACKSWDSYWVSQYWLANQQAAEAGLPIQRVFLETDPKAKAAAQRQADLGICASTIREDDFQLVGEKVRIPNDVGFVILDSPEGSRVLVHSGLGSHAIGLLIRSAEVVEQFRTIFCSASLRASAVRVSVPPPAQGHDRDKRASKRTAARYPVLATVQAKALRGLVIERNDGQDGLRLCLPSKCKCGERVTIEPSDGVPGFVASDWEVVYASVIDGEPGQPRFMHGIRARQPAPGPA